MNNLEKTSSTVPAQIEKLPFSQLIRRIGGYCSYRGRCRCRRYHHRVDVRGGLWLLFVMAADPHCLYGDHVYVDDLSYLDAHRNAVNRGDTSLLR